MPISLIMAVDLFLLVTCPGFAGIHANVGDKIIL